MAEDDYDSPMIYIGCIGVNQSMKTLDIHTRSDVAKESIKRLCEATGIERDFITKRKEPVDHMLDKEPNLVNSGREIELTVTSEHFHISGRDNKEIIIEHEMFNISFASPGDPETSDFVAYVANDDKYGRACFVIKCSIDSAKELLNNIRRCFKLRSHQLHNMDSFKDTSPFCSEPFSGLIRNTPNLKDQANIFSFEQLNPRINNENQQNDEIINQTRASLENEPWFHGSYLPREASEERLRQDGDFLVRESLLDQGHFVLSIMHEGEKLHILFDSMGKVQMKDTTFDNIIHLVKYHQEKQLPIVDKDNRHIYLRNPVRAPTKQSQTNSIL